MHLRSETGEVTRLRLPDFPVDADDDLVQAILGCLPGAEVWVGKGAAEARAGGPGRPA